MAVKESKTSLVRLLAAANFSEFWPPGLGKGRRAKPAQGADTAAFLSCIALGKPEDRVR